MGYKIQYDLMGNAKKAMLDRKRNVLPVLRVILVMFVIFSLGLLLHYRNIVLELLLPGDYATTVAAFRELISEWRFGNSAGDALAAFCKEILTDAAK